MSIWKTLGIEPTTDKRAIRKAYASKTREIHPEEKPEEFRRLHEAYQAALGYADYVKQVRQSGGSVTSFYRTEEDEPEGAADDTDEDAAQSAADNADETKNAGESEGVCADETAEEPDTGGEIEITGETQAKLWAYFDENQERQEQRVDDFLTYWNALESPYRNPWEIDNLREFLSSAAFQDIRYHTRVLKTLADEIDDKFFYGINELKLLFWDAYGFQEDEEDVYQGDRQRLWRSLYPAYKKRQQSIEAEQKRIKRNKITHVMMTAAVAAVLVAVLFSFVDTHRRREKESLYLIDYMESRYSGTSFSEPERVGKNGFDGGSVYTMRSLLHPELTATAEVYYKYVEGRKERLVTENYDRLLFEYYAEQYGLQSDWVSEHNAICYTDIGEIDEICAQVEKMFQEQEELQTITEVAFYTEQVLFPEILFLGGLPDQPFAGSRIYDLSTMKAAELSAALRETYMLYMFQYEPWNITTKQYREWGAAYETFCEGLENDDGEWHEVYDPDTGECLCRLFVCTYERIDGSYNIDRISVPRRVRMMSAGNAYYFLQDQGADVTVMEDGDGFEVTFYGTVRQFGFSPEVEFDDLRGWY